MKIIIDISEEEYKNVRWGKAKASMMRRAIMTGIKLPNDLYMFNKIDEASKIIKTDKL